MRDPEALKDTVLAEDGFLTMDPENPTLEQEPGVPLERVVGMPYEEALFLDDIEPEAQQYWFTEPADGWKTKKVRMRKLEEATVGMESLANSFGHTGAALEGRLSMDELREGQLLTGTVVAQMLTWQSWWPLEERWRSECTACATPATSASRFSWRR